MLGKVIIENGQKKIQALTADTGTGAPVGSYLYLEKKSNPQGYLYCDGSTFDETAYPALYQYLGTNVLPDWREFSAVGAEQNTTNVYDAQTNPNGVIHDHDVFTQGQAKDDQLQDHKHDYVEDYSDDTGSNKRGIIVLNNYAQPINTKVINARTGTVTRGKSRAVFIYIKATSGLTENQQENVLNTINENNSYSTEEHPTGKKWIDGKPIYQITIKDSNINTTPKVLYTIPNLSNIAKIQAVYKSSTNIFPAWYAGSSDFNWARCDGNNLIWEYGSGVTPPEEVTVTIEYTKTTD